MRLFLIALLLVCNSHSSRLTAGVVELFGLSTDTDLFNTAVSATLARRLGCTSVLDSTFVFDQSIAVVFYLWCNDAVQTSLLRTKVANWPVLGDQGLFRAIAADSIDAFAVEPTNVAFELCPSSNYGSPTVIPVEPAVADCGSAKLSLKVSSGLSDAVLRSTLCTVLSLSCENIQVTLASSGVFLVTLATSEPLTFITELVDRAANRQLSSLGLAEISVVSGTDSVPVFVKGMIIDSTFDGSFQECMAELWYLLFLILAIPLSYVITSGCYTRGKKRGRLAAREQEEEAKEKARLMVAHTQNWQQAMHRPQFMNTHYAHPGMFQPVVPHQ